MNQLSHEQVAELLGAYAVNAVESDERASIEAHLDHCADCRKEADELLETASLLGSSAPIEAPDVWNRIKSEINPAMTPPPLRMPTAPSREAKVTRWVFASAAALMILFGAFAAGSLVSNKDDSSLAAQQVAAQAAAASPDARIISLSSSTNGATAKVVVLPDGHGYIYDGDLPALPEGRTYQLWAIINNTPISAGVMGRSVSAAPFMAVGPVAAFAITDEVDGGVVNSSRSPIVAGKVTA